MVYIIGYLNKKDELQPKIFKFLKSILNVEYKIIYASNHIIESTLSDIDVLNDIVLWHPIIAHKNLDLVKKYNKSTVILLTRTILIQKVSLNNPINEEMAINHGFTIMYVDEEFNDITNQDWKLILQESNYILTHSKFIELANDRRKNY